MENNFQFVALDKKAFEPLFELDDAALKEKGMRKMVADEFPGFPCRVSLEDAAVGEEVILLNYEHHAVNSPYRSSGPIFVRKAAKTATPKANEIPLMFHHRLLSIRGYDDASMLVFADVVKGADLRDQLVEILKDPQIQYLHIHNAKPGCYNCRVVRI